ncbi:MAG: ATP-dependent helicase HrpB [Kordiimonadaceae bacterium]|nr:ATP-dependent helicase HrpB [Kordiimonadaceae bacterium]MBT6033187.1 ATP-dependent helicase HrpB [Kordiimonadaceae bacterium]
MTISLPIYEIIPKLKKILSEKGSLVLQAPPGAGKTTIVPLEVLNETLLGSQKIIMLEPRRLAARAAAKRMADTLGEKVGETVGYRVRMESKVGPRTRIEVVTEGVFIRKLQNDPELKGIGLVIFDEFHERSIDTDLGLALSLDVQDGLREDLKIIVMSATLDGERVAKLIGDAPVITSEGRSFNVNHHYLEKTTSTRIENDITGIILKALMEQSGSILVFLPGAGEIERTKKLLESKNLGPDILICPLYGMMQFKDQDLAISPAQKGKRKIVLSTSIAETSLTIEGIRIVIDGGLQRNASYDVSSGMSRLVTSKLSKASAEQRAGRAGRIEDGICYRMWTQAANRALKPYTEPEIKRADLVPLTLSLALWGVTEASDLKWLDAPEQASFNKSKDLLHSLGAMDEKGRITDHGKLMAGFPMHPRLAHMVLKAQEFNCGQLALNIAALLEERDILYLKPDQKTADLRLRLEAIEHVKAGEIHQAKMLGCDIGAAKKIIKQVNIWKKSNRIVQDSIDIQKAGICLAIAFPDRIGGLRSTGKGSYLLSGGRGAKLMDADPLVSEKYLSIGHLDKGDRDARIYLAAPVQLPELEECFKHIIKREQVIVWEDRTQIVKAQKQILLGQLPLAISKLDQPNADDIKMAMVAGIKKMGLNSLPWGKKSTMFMQRVQLVNNHLDNVLPDFSEEELLESIDVWLLPYLENIKSRAALGKFDLYAILKNILNWEQQQKLDKMAPLDFKVPSGSKISIDYQSDPPVLSVKLQEMFGAIKTPSILDGKVALTVHLLSPARRPLQITTDLEGFWNNSYPEIKKEMKGRYPKHPWPDDPHMALATKKLKPRK